MKLSALFAAALLGFAASAPTTQDDGYHEHCHWHPTLSERELKRTDIESLCNRYDRYEFTTREAGGRYNTWRIYCDFWVTKGTWHEVRCTSPYDELIKGEDKYPEMRALWYKEAGVCNVITSDPADQFGMSPAPGIKHHVIARIDKDAYFR